MAGKQNDSKAKRKRVDVDLTGSDEGADDSHQPSPKSSRHHYEQNSQPSSQAGSHSAPQSSPASSQRRSSVHGGVLNAGFASFPSQHTEAERAGWLADDDGDVDELVASSQAVVDDYDHFFLYGNLSTKIVGVQYYRGHANPGEHILVRREPGNPYDSNAIRIDNVSQSQIGHIPRKTAEKLARHIDNHWLTVIGTLAGSVGPFDCPLTIQMWGPHPTSQAGKELIEQMTIDRLPMQGVKAEEAKQKKAVTAARRQAATGEGEWSSQPTVGDGENVVMADVLEASQRFDARRADNHEAYGIQEADLERMPAAPKPEAIKTDMLPYQLQALQWLLDHEDPQPPLAGAANAVQLWCREEGNRARYTNLATQHTVNTLPDLASGGILADDMGLGKTLEMISLIVANAKGEGRGTTLIVAPLSVMSNWSGQITQHVHDDHALAVYTYHGSGRVKMTASDFERFDVVITTYQTLASDYMPRGKKAEKPAAGLRADGLYSMKWRRIILDEGHTIRNPQSKGAAAVTAIMAKSRWVLTGTPIVNSLKDLYSLLRFFGITGGLASLEIFNDVLIRPLKNADESGVFLLKAIMKAFTLRRRKDMKYIDLRLPELEEYLHRIKFATQERKRYDALAAEAKGVLKKFEQKKAAPGEKTENSFHYLLEILLRMRQCCNHWQLCKERVTSLLAQLEEQKTVELTSENVTALQEMLQVQIESQEDCAICLESLHEPVITNCGHFFGRSCITQVIERQHKCPMCRAELRDEQCLVEPENSCGDDDMATDQVEADSSSSKVDALIKILQASKSSGNKTIVFSQWTSFLDIVQARLDGFKFCRLDGTMSAHERDRALDALENDPGTTVMLASLGVCAVGLNLTAANQIILSDTWWAPAIEDQAIDRVHRLGQKKVTKVFRLVMDESIEDKTLEIQKTKRDLMNMAFSEKNGKRDRVRQGRLADIQQLLQ